MLQVMSRLWLLQIERAFGWYVKWYVIFTFVKVKPQDFPTESFVRVHIIRIDSLSIVKMLFGENILQVVLKCNLCTCILISCHTHPSQVLFRFYHSSSVEGKCTFQHHTVSSWGTATQVCVSLLHHFTPQTWLDSGFLRAARWGPGVWGKLFLGDWMSIKCKVCDLLLGII